MSDESILSSAQITETFRAEGPVRSYRARTGDGREMCVKTVLASQEEAAEALGRFASLRAIRSPVLASIIEFGQTENGYYVVREWVHGTHLGSTPLPPAMTPDVLAKAVADALDALAAIHTKGLVHGDIRPSNIVVTYEGKTKLVDTLIPGVPVGRAGDPASSARYTSPEEIAGQAPTAATDLYRMGLVLHELLAGSPAFDGSDAAEVIEGHRSVTAAAPSAVAPGSPVALDPVVAVALNKAPEERFPSAAVMAKAVRTAIGVRTSRRWVWIMLAAMLAVALVGGGVGAWWWFGQAPSVVVPQLVGQQRADAESALRKIGLTVGKVTEEQTLAQPPGTVTAQTPKAGAEAAAGSAVSISVATTPKVMLPMVIGAPIEDAQVRLAQSGLRTGAITYELDRKVRPGFVKSQIPSEATEVTVGVPVALTVSMGGVAGRVPDVVGLSANDASTVLVAAGFGSRVKKKASAAIAPGDVMSQKPKAGSALLAGIPVDITVSTGVKDATGTVVPQLTGQGVVEAIQSLIGLNLHMGFSFVEDSANPLKVTALTPAAGTAVDPGSRVILSVGLPGWALLQTVPGEAPEPAPATSAVPPTTTPAPAATTSPTTPSTTTP